MTEHEPDTPTPLEASPEAVESEAPRPRLPLALIAVQTALVVALGVWLLVLQRRRLEEGLASRPDLLGRLSAGTWRSSASAHS